MRFGGFTINNLEHFELFQVVFGLNERMNAFEIGTLDGTILRKEKRSLKLFSILKFYVT